MIPQVLSAWKHECTLRLRGILHIQYSVEQSLSARRGLESTVLETPLPPFVHARPIVSHCSRRQVHIRDAINASGCGRRASHRGSPDQGE